MQISSWKCSQFLQINYFLQNKIISQQEVESLQPENKINLEDELLLDALMSDNVDVHPLLTLTVTDDVVHSLSVADAVYTRPQLTDSLGAQHVCTTTTTTTAT